MGRSGLDELVVWLEERGHQDLADLALSCIRETAGTALEQRRMTAGFLADEIAQRLSRKAGKNNPAPLEYLIMIGKKTVLFEDGLADLGTILACQDQPVEARLIVRLKGRAGGTRVCLDRQGVFLHAGCTEYSLPLVLQHGSGGTLKISLVVNGTKTSLHAGYQVITIRQRGVTDCGTVDQLESSTSAVLLRIPLVAHGISQQIYDLTARVADIDGECRIIHDELVVSFFRGTDFVAMVRQIGQKGTGDRQGGQTNPVFDLHLAVPGQDPLVVRCRIRIAAPQVSASVQGSTITVTSSNGIPGFLRILEDGQETYSGCCAGMTHTVKAQDHNPDIIITMDGREILHQTLALREQYRLDEQRRLLPVWIFLALLQPGLIALAIYGITNKATWAGVLGVAGFAVLTVGLAISTLGRILDGLRESNPLLAIGLGILAFVFWPVSLTLLGILAVFRPWIEIREALSSRNPTL